jgi:hypothetical protein
MKRTPLKRKTPLRAKMPKFGEKIVKVPKYTHGNKNALKVPKQRKSIKGKSTSWYKKELDRVFSIYIRLKFPKRCYTCGKVDVTLQCGHFVSRQYLATRWSEDNCRPQCVGCNMFGNGQLLDFEENLKKELGDEFVENMKKSRHQMFKLDRQWYESEIAKYKSMI